MLDSAPAGRRRQNSEQKSSRLAFYAIYENLSQNVPTADGANLLSQEIKNMTTIFSLPYCLFPDIMSDIFKLRENTYSLRNFHIFESQNPRTKKFGLDSIAYGTSQLWKNVPEEIRNSTSLPMFKKKIKKVPLISCSHSCCRKYIHHVGFI